MKNRNIGWMRQLFIWCVAMLVVTAAQARQQVDSLQPQSRVELETLGRRLEVGDVVFIRIPNRLFTQVADTTRSWTNHVGIVTDVSGREPLVSESRFPLSGTTTWSRFVARSEHGRVVVGRLVRPLDAAQRGKLAAAVAARAGILYDTGFNLHSRRQFCSRYVREVLDEAAGIRLGRVEKFSALLANNPQADLSYWRLWYFGYIPWQRETVTPASLLGDSRLHKVFDGHVNTALAFKGE